LGIALGAEPGRVVVAWVATLIASLLPDILARSFLPRIALAGIGIGRLGVLLGLSGLATVSEELQPVSGYVLALAASAFGDLLVTLIQRAKRWQSWEATAAETEQLSAEALLHLIPAACMALTVVGRLSPQQLFLQSPSMAEVRLPMLSPLSWWVIAPILALVLAGPFLPGALAAMRAGSVSRTVRALVGGAPFGVINAAQEEFRFRAVLLATAVPSLGAGQGLAMSSVFFGLGHYFGHPSGRTGIVLAGIAGWVLGETMLSTGSFLPPWLIHVLLDVLIFATAAVGRPGSAPRRRRRCRQ
jgi:membrane protease YdiL (CAAX protease family)